MKKTKKKVLENIQKVDKKTRTLLVYNHIQTGLSPSELWKKERLTKNQVKKSLIDLRRSNSIRKEGYGTWEVIHYNIKQKEGSLTYPYNPSLTGGYDVKKLPQDHVRGHAFRISLRIPNLKDWENRSTYLDKLKIDYIPIPQGQRIVFKKFKIWLCKESIVIIAPKGYAWFEKTAKRSKKNVIIFMLNLIRQLERTLKVSSFKINNNYQLKFSRQHYSLIKNALAKEYNDQKKKLYIADWSGLWLIIDNSYNINELETTHHKTADKDSKTVLEFFNDLKHNPIKPSQLLQIQHGLVTEQKQYRHDLLDYGKNIAAHGRSIDILGSSISKLTEKIGQLDMKPNKTPQNEDLAHIEITQYVDPFVAELKGLLQDYPELYAGSKIWLNKNVADVLINKKLAISI